MDSALPRRESRGEWKSFLDMWFERSVYGRGAVLTTIPIQDLTGSITERPSALPKFWKLAVKHERQLTLVPIALTREGASTQPAIDHPNFKVKFNIVVKYFRDRGGVKSLGDIYQPDGSLYSREHILEECDQRLKRDDNGDYKLTKQTRVSPERMWEEWEDILKQIPMHLANAARGLPPTFPAVPKPRRGVISDHWSDFTNPTSTRDGVGEHILRRKLDPSRIRREWEATLPFPTPTTQCGGWEGGPIPGGTGTTRAGEFVISPPEWGQFREKGAFESLAPPSRKRGAAIEFVPKGTEITSPTASVKKKRPPIKPEVVVILNDPHEFDLRYGIPNKAPYRHLLRVVQLTKDGVPKPTSEVLERDPDTYLPVAWWGRGVTGPLSMAFPLPGEWSFAGSTRTLDKMDASTLTAIFSSQHRLPPACISRWEGYKQRTPLKVTHGSHPMTTGATRLNVQKIGNLYSTAMLPPKIWILQFKFILHARFVPTWLLEDHEDEGCRLKCGCRRESVEHLAVCPALSPLRAKLAELTEEAQFVSNNLTFLIGDSGYGALTRGATSLWLCMWYALILAMIDCTEDGVAVTTDKVWKHTLYLFADAALATSHEASKLIGRAVSRGKPPPDEFPALSARLTPLGEISSDGAVTWAPRVKAELKELGLEGYINHVT